MSSRRGFLAAAVLLAGVFCLGPSPALYGSVTTHDGVVTNPLNLDPAVRHAYQLFYIQDYSGAVSRLSEIVAAHPQDPIAVDYLLDATLFQELYRLDLLDTTFYAHDGFLTGKHPAVKVSEQTAQKIHSLADKAVRLANARLDQNPDDVDALYARAWAHALNAVYTGMVDRNFVSALRMALQARSDDQKVLARSPHYVDAKMVVGIHEYIVGSLPFGFKVLAGLVGIHGSKTKGIAELREAGSRGVITSVEARVALSLFLRREARYGRAIEVMKSLRDEYPRDFLFCLEVANLTKDIGEGPQAVVSYRALIEQAKKPGYFPAPRPELAWFGLAEALRGQKEYQVAVDAYEQVTENSRASAELRARCALNAGEVHDLMENREKAVKMYRAAIREDGNSSVAASARKYLKTPYAGKSH